MKIKNGVSNWVLIFQNGEKIKLDKCCSENISISSDGTYSIIIEEVELIDELFENIRVGIMLDEIQQENVIYEVNPNGCLSSRLQIPIWNYPNPILTDINFEGKETDATIFTIKLTGKFR